MSSDKSKGEKVLHSAKVRFFPDKPGIASVIHIQKKIEKKSCVTMLPQIHSSIRETRLSDF